MRAPSITRSLRTATVLALTLVALTAGAQPSVRESASHEPVTPQEIERRLAARAAEVQNMAPQGASRYVMFDLAWATTPEEHRKLGGNAVMYLAAFSKREDELPLSRVYARFGGKTVVLQKISSERTEVAKDTIVHRIFGPYRENSFYLVPAGVWRNGEIGCDFATNRKDFGITRGPLEPPAFIQKERANRPAGKPAPEAVQALIQREFPGLAR